MPRAGISRPGASARGQYDTCAYHAIHVRTLVYRGAARRRGAYPAGRRARTAVHRIRSSEEYAAVQLYARTAVHCIRVYTDMFY